jgi:hypothetical protein
MLQNAVHANTKHMKWPGSPPADLHELTNMNLSCCRMPAGSKHHATAISHATDSTCYQGGGYVMKETAACKHCPFLPPRWGAGPMALMLWLDLVI